MRTDEENVSVFNLTPPPSLAGEGLKMTERGAQKTQSLLPQEPEESFLRIRISGGGCAGFQYAISIDSTQSPEDLCFQGPTFRVIIDPSSYTLVQGATIDYFEDMMGAAFVMAIPNAATSCGCGTSFSMQIT